MHDPVNHPSHYTDSHPGIECIRLTETMSFCIGNAIKYVWRCHAKNNEPQDIRKAAWYLDHAIDNHEPPPGIDPTQQHILNQLKTDALDHHRPNEADFWQSLLIGRLDYASTALAGMLSDTQDDMIREDLQ